jgi:hypothetical protein
MADCQQVLLLVAENRLLFRHDLISQLFNANKFLHDQAAEAF